MVKLSLGDIEFSLAEEQMMRVQGTALIMVVTVEVQWKSGGLVVDTITTAGPTDGNSPPGEPAINIRPDGLDRANAMAALPSLAGAREDKESTTAEVWPRGSASAAPQQEMAARSAGGNEAMDGANGTIMVDTAKAVAADAPAADDPTLSTERPNINLHGEPMLLFFNRVRVLMPAPTSLPTQEATVRQEDMTDEEQDSDPEDEPASEDGSDSEQSTVYFSGSDHDDDEDDDDDEGGVAPQNQVSAPESSDAVVTQQQSDYPVEEAAPETEPESNVNPGDVETVQEEEERRAPGPAMTEVEAEAEDSDEDDVDAEEAVEDAMDTTPSSSQFNRRHRRRSPSSSDSEPPSKRFRADSASGPDWPSDDEMNFTDEESIAAEDMDLPSSEDEEEGNESGPEWPSDDAMDFTDEESIAAEHMELPESDEEEDAPAPARHDLSPPPAFMGNAAMPDDEMDEGREDLEESYLADDDMEDVVEEDADADDEDEEEDDEPATSAKVAAPPAPPPPPGANKGGVQRSIRPVGAGNFLNIARSLRLGLQNGIRSDEAGDRLHLLLHALLSTHRREIMVLDDVLSLIRWRSSVRRILAAVRFNGLPADLSSLIRLLHRIEKFFSEHNL